MTGSFELRPVLFYGGCGFTIMRCMSFALENCGKKEGNYSILELLKYNFYLPFFYFGPIMTFDKFYVQVLHQRCDKQVNLRTKLCCVLYFIHVQIMPNLAIQSIKCVRLYTQISILRGDWSFSSTRGCCRLYIKHKANFTNTPSISYRVQQQQQQPVYGSYINS